MAFGMENRRKIVGGVSHLENFVVGNVRGAWYPDVTSLPTGKLAGNWVRQLREEPGITYVVYSYGTPIAWRGAGSEWIIPNTHYSVTTSHHLSLVKQGIKARDERIALAMSECC